MRALRVDSHMPNNFLVRSAALVCALALGAGCVTPVVNPVTGRPEYTTMSPAQEVQIGKQAAQEVAQQVGFIESAPARDYVATLGGRLAQFSPRRDVPYEFHAVEMEDTNAFALPGGYVYVSRGLLALANSEDELAGVLGHEIGHVAARHSAQRQTRGQVAGIGTAIATIGAAILGGGELVQGVAQLAQAGAQGWLASYSRGQELQSDKIGQSLAAQAGYDPAAISTFLAALGREQEIKLGKKRQSTFLDSHPSSEERVQRTRARAAEYPRAGTPPIARDRSDFVKRFEGLLVGPDPGQGIFRDELFLHPDLDFALRFPRGWQTQNSPQAVMAKPPEGQGQALIALIAVPKSEGADARAAARKLLSDAAQQNLPAEDGGGERVGSLRGHRVRVLSQTTLIERTYFDHGGMVFALQEAAPQQQFTQWEESFDATRKSFRRVDHDDRALITEVRLRLVSARAGETLEKVSQRSNNSWSAAETALFNGLRGDEKLAAGFLVKIGHQQPYTKKAKPTATAGDETSL